ncbi:MAG: substrate-binding domain-containing protein [Oleispira sp.]|nr:substrate-binding domain-containing protein [Oleispira sp.]
MLNTCLFRCFCRVLLPLKLLFAAFTHAELAAFDDTLPDSSSALFTLQGSNTIGARLAPELVKAFLLAKGAAEVIVVAGENESRINAKMGPRQVPVWVDIAAHGSGTGFDGLLKGSADIAAASRPAKPKEIKALAGFTDLTDERSEHIIGIDGLAIIIHPQNPIQQLSVKQVALIFSGQINDWSQLGGRRGKINLYSRDDRSGTWDSFKRMVLGKNHTLDVAAKRFESNDNLSDEVSADIDGIGFVGLPSVRKAKLIAISDGFGKALKPNKLTIATEDYALSRRLYFYTHDESDNPYVREFIAFVEGVAGQNTVAANGFIAQQVEVVVPQGYRDLPQNFQEITPSEQRLTVNFRFKQGSAQLDNRALRDIDRLVQFITKQEDKKLTLIGFGDQKRSPERAQLLSKLRAMAVRRELVKQGVYPQSSHGYGEQLPVASNEREAGRYKNRRVEVWLGKK